MRAAALKKNPWWEDERLLWAKPEELTVSQCADKYRVLGNSSAKPGQWETSYVPFMRDVMDAFGYDCVEELWIVKPTQTGGTEALLNMILYAILQDPGPAMIVEPTGELAAEVSRDRIDIMIESCDRLKEVQDEDPDETRKMKKTFQSMSLYFAWSRSPTSLASRPIRYVFLDEVNKYPPFSGQEASPIALAKERTNTFIYTRKIIYNSTPTLDVGYITVGEKNCDARFRCHVPCPHCGHMQTLVFEDAGSPRGVKWDKDVKLNAVEESAWYECESCHERIYNDHKGEMLRRHKWIDLISGLDFETCMREARPKRVGFQINRLYSPWHTFGMVAREFLESKDYPEKLMNWKNSWMAEPWVDQIESKTVSELRCRCINIDPMVCPQGTIALTCGIDPGQGGYWFVVVAWKQDETPHLIHYGFLVGWDSVTQLVWENQYGVYNEPEQRFSIWRAGIDTGGGRDEFSSATMTEEAYDWLRKYGRGKVFGTKGMSHETARIKFSEIDKMPKGTPMPKLTLVLINTSEFKDKVHLRLQAEIGKPGAFTFHADVGDDLFSHITAEEKRKIIRSGKVVIEWTRIRPGNHLLDCLVSAFAMADPAFMGGINVLRPRTRVESSDRDKPKNWINDKVKRPGSNWITGR